MYMFIYLDASDELNQPNMEVLVKKYTQPHLLNLPTLVPVLNKYHLLTQSDNYTLANHLIPPVERASALLYVMLPSKGPEAYETFVKCLQEETEHLGHQELAGRLTVSKCKNITNVYVDIFVLVFSKKQYSCTTNLLS